MTGLIAELEIDYSAPIAGAEDFAQQLDAQLQAAVENFSSSMTGAFDGADIGGATSSVNQYSSAVSEATTSTEGLSKASTGLGAAAGIATGSSSELKGAIAEIGPAALGATVGGVAALGAGMFELYNKGLDATSAAQRFSFVLGDMADKVQQVHVGDMNTTLDDLAKKMGSTTSAMQQAVATTYQFAVNAGASKETAAQFSDNLYALASRAVALNPALGDVSDVAQRMEVGLGRARSAAQQFGIAISQGEINTRAMADTGKSSASELNAYEKSVAGAEIALEKYGGTLNETVAKGSENAAIKQRTLQATLTETLEKLGAPLVTPMFDIMQAAIPIVDALGQILSELGTAFLPSVAFALQAVAGPLQLFADLMKVIQPVLPEIAAGFLAFEAAQFIPGLLAAMSTAFQAFGTSAIAEMIAVDGAALDMSASISTAAAATEASLGPIGWLAAGLGVAATAFGIYGDNANNASQASKDFADQLTKTTDSSLLDTFTQQVAKLIIQGELFGGTTNATSVELSHFRDIAEQNIGTAQRLLDAQGPLTPMGQQYAAILDQVTAKQKAQSSAQDESKVAADKLTASTNPLADAMAAYNAQTNTATTATKDFKTALQDLTNINGDVTAATISLGNAQQKTFETVVKNGLQFDLNTQAGRDNVAAMQQQVAAAEQLAEATVKQTGKTADGKAVMDNFTSTLVDNLTKLGVDKDAVDNLVTSLGLIPPAKSTTVTADTSQAQTAVDNLIATLTRITGQSWDAIVTATTQIDNQAGIPTRMAGGPVASGQPYLVGEVGPELFVPGGSGTIVPNNKLGVAAGAGGPQPLAIDLMIQMDPNTGAVTAQTTAKNAASQAVEVRSVRAVVGALV